MNISLSKIYISILLKVIRMIHVILHSSSRNMIHNGIKYDKVFDLPKLGVQIFDSNNKRQKAFDWIIKYIKSNINKMILINIICEHGQHRSVDMVNDIGKYLQLNDHSQTSYNVEIKHLSLNL